MEEKKHSFRMSRSFNLKRMFEGSAKHVHNLSFAGDPWNDDHYKLQTRSFLPPSPRRTNLQQHDHHPLTSINPPSDADQIKERFAKLLLGEDMSGGGKGVSSALALSNAITNLAASVFGEQRKLEPMSPDMKKRWRKEIDWLLSVTDHIVEFVPSKQQSPDGTSMEIMVTRQRNDIHMNIPALRKLDGMLIERLDNFAHQNEFWYASKDDMEDGKETVQRTDDKWWLPAAKVPAEGLSETSRKWLQHQKDCVNQVLKAAMAINAEIVSEMEVPESYIESLPKNGRSSLGDSLYKNITDEYLDPEQFLAAVDLSTEHKVLDLKNRIEASVVIWKRKMNSKDYKSHWSGMPPAVSTEKREIFEERAETILAILKQRFPGLPQSAFEISKIEHNKDVGHAILESYSRTIESLAHTVMSRIDGVLYADQLVQDSSNKTALMLLSPSSSGRTENSDIAKSPRSPSLSHFMGWNGNKGEVETRKNEPKATLIDPSNIENEKIITKIANIVTNMKITYLEKI
uniref:PRONE domain-containing protein n=1 Tax=Kalanchoe fedtschenkoi TaxID=63787 RepID=A0A7N0ZUX6_KALFE